MDRKVNVPATRERTGEIWCDVGALAIPLSRGLVAVVDEGDFQRLAAYRWYASPACQRERKFYAVRQERKGGLNRNIYMHREILFCNDGEIADHINSDTLDNRRRNQRVATRQLNNVNRRYRSMSGYRGVYIERRASGNGFTYLAQITVEYRSRNIGRFQSAEEAARAYDAEAERAFGEFAVLNFPGGAR